MTIVTITEAKLHLRVDQTAEDALLAIYISAAEDYITQYLNQPSIPQTAAIKAAALLIIGDLYENREAGSEKDIKQNPAVDRLLHQYRRGIGV